MPSKGKTLSTKAIDKMKESKLLKLLSKYNWVLSEPYLDVEIKNGSNKRINQYIIFREFKNNILSGLSINDMVLMGISRKVLQFFSNFCQGKISLTKEQFEKSYEQGMSLEEISKEYSITREDLTYLRQLYNIKRRGATYINRKKTEAALTYRQKAIIYGSLMGDAKRQHSYSYASVGFGHSSKQESYLKWKYIELENLCSKNSLKYYPSNDNREDFKGHKGSWRFYTLANTYVENILKQFYKKDKQITMDILDNLSKLSLAVWFLDDGITDWRHRDRIKGLNYTPEIRFCTDSFSKESCNNIVEWFRKRWSINSHLRENRPNQYRVIIDSISAFDFLDLIRPHVIPSMRYKVDYEEYKKNLKSESKKV